MLEKQILNLLDLALDLDEGKEKEIKEIIKNVKLVIEIGGILGSGVYNVLEIYKGNEVKSEAERVKALVDLQDELKSLLDS